MTTFKPGDRVAWNYSTRDTAYAEGDLSYLNGLLGTVTADGYVTAVVKWDRSYEFPRHYHFDTPNGRAAFTDNLILVKEPTVNPTEPTNFRGLKRGDRVVYKNSWGGHDRHNGKTGVVRKIEYGEAVVDWDIRGDAPISTPNYENISLAPAVAPEFDDTIADLRAKAEDARSLAAKYDAAIAALEALK